MGYINLKNINEKVKEFLGEEDKYRLELIISVGVENELQVVAKRNEKVSNILDSIVSLIKFSVNENAIRKVMGNSDNISRELGNLDRHIIIRKIKKLDEIIISSLREIGSIGFGFKKPFWIFGQRYVYFSIIFTPFTGAKKFTVKAEGKITKI